MLLRDTIFLVDPSSSSRGALRRIFEGQFNVLEASTREQAELLFRHNHSYIAAALIDINLFSSVSPAFSLDLSLRPNISQIPLIAIVDADDTLGEHRTFQLGFTDAIFRPFHHVAVERRVTNLIGLYQNKWTLEDLVTEQSMTLRHTNEMMVDALSSIIEYRSVESGQHILRIRRFTHILLDELARCCPEYALTPAIIASISSASALHDIGKIAIPDAILNKPGPLTEDEFELMKTHTVSGSDILHQLGELGNEEYLRYAYNICRYHHERWTGMGYPEGLAGDEIPICAQVVGLADAYDALTSRRVYKEAYSCSEAANMILNGDCGIFSPKLLECFKHVRRDFAELASSYADGLSPKSDAISAPLAPPLRGAASTLQMLLTKHSALLHYIDATVMEVDLDEGIYHTVYCPDPDFKMDGDVPSLDAALSVWAKTMVASDGTPLPSFRLMASLEMLFASGQRQVSYHNLITGMDGRPHPYTVTLLRLETEGSSRKVMILWRKEDHTDQTDIPSSDQNLKQALIRLLGLSQPVLFDRWLTMDTAGQTLCSLVGYSPKDLQQLFQNKLISLIPPTERDNVLTSLRRQLDHGPVCEIELPLLHRDGHLIWTVAKGVLSSGQHGSELLYLVLVDITRTKTAQEKLQQTLQQQQLIMDQSSDIVFELDFKSDRMTCSSKWEERFGYQPLSTNVTAELSKASHVHPDDVQLFLSKMAQMKAGTEFAEMVIRISDSTGRYLWSRVKSSLQRDSYGNPARAVGVFIDIDDELRSSWALMDTADRDSLTKLLNKGACRREVEAYLSTNPANTLSALAIIDLDNFKKVNDQFGHLFGDTILSRISTEISRMFRGTDIVGRIGGDEFMVFMTEIPSKSLAIERFQILISTIQHLLSSQTEDLSLSCSVGIAFSPDHGSIYEDLFQRADRALYHAKSQGKNRYWIYSPEVSSASFSTMVSKRIDSNEHPGLANNGLIQFVFERLYESGDVEDTIRALLEIVGKQMDVSRVYIFENNLDNTTCSNTFEWCNEGIPAEIDTLQDVSYITDIPGYHTMFNERGIFYCPDVSQLPQHLKDILDPQGIKSMLQCAIRDQGVFRGYVGFDENESTRLWTQEQIDLLTFLSQVLSVFLLKHRMQTHTNNLVQELRSVLDHRHSWTYVIDSSNHRILFLNGKTADTAPDAYVGAVCHKVLMGQDSPCKDCPVGLGPEGGECIINNTHLKVKVRASADPVRWDGKDAWLLSCWSVT